MDFPLRDLDITIVRYNLIIFSCIVNYALSIVAILEHQVFRYFIFTFFQDELVNSRLNYIFYVLLYNGYVKFDNCSERLPSKFYNLNLLIQKTLYIVSIIIISLFSALKQVCICIACLHALLPGRSPHFHAGFGLGTCDMLR